MATVGYFAYRYQRYYYRKHLPRGAYMSGFGQRLFNSIPRDAAALQAWLEEKIRMLEKFKTDDVEDLFTDGAFEIDKTDWGYEVYDDADWTFSFVEEQKWTYVIDLDNRVLTLNGTAHFRLDNMPPSDRHPRYYANEDCRPGVARQYSKSLPELDLWPAPKFIVEERRQAYDSLASTIVPVEEWGALAWDKLSHSQRFSVDRFLDYRFPRAAYFAYAPKYRLVIGRFCWNMLCTATPGVPLIHYDAKSSDKFIASRHGKKPNAMVNETVAEVFKSFEAGDRADYCWVRGHLITFCAQLGEQAYIAHEVEQMVRKMYHGGHTECVGIILSCQREMIVVAIDHGLTPSCRVRHTPVLNIGPISGTPGRASDGLLLLVSLLSPLMNTPTLPWRNPQPRQPACIWPLAALPVEVLQHIIHYTDTNTYLSLCRVSRLIRSICLANPRVGEYTILRKVPGFRRTYVARCAGDETRRRIRIAWVLVPSEVAIGQWVVDEMEGSERVMEIVSADGEVSESKSN